MNVNLRPAKTGDLMTDRANFMAWIAANSAARTEAQHEAEDDQRTRKVAEREWPAGKLAAYEAEHGPLQTSAVNREVFRRSRAEIAADFGTGTGK